MEHVTLTAQELKKKKNIAPEQWKRNIYENEWCIQILSLETKKPVILSYGAQMEEFKCVIIQTGPPCHQRDFSDRHGLHQKKYDQ